MNENRKTKDTAETGTDEGLGSFLSRTAFIGTDAAHQTIHEELYWINLLGAPQPGDWANPKMREARQKWNEAIEKAADDDVLDEARACELVTHLFVDSLRDRIMVDAISGAEDEFTYGSVIRGTFEGQPDWSRVNGTQMLLVKMVYHTPAEDRAPLFCFLGWLSWYKGESVAALDYFEVALRINGQHTISRLMRNQVGRGHVPKVDLNKRTAYRSYKPH